MLNTSEDLDMKEMIVVMEKLTDPGYQHDQVKRDIVEGLTGYERGRRFCLPDPSNRKFRPLQ
jgi:hypothetical protein